MIKACDNCWATYDTERRDANEFYCPKCNGRIRRVENGLEG